MTGGERPPVFEYSSKLPVSGVARRRGQTVVVVLAPGLAQRAHRGLLVELLTVDELAVYDQEGR